MIRSSFITTLLSCILLTAGLSKPVSAQEIPHQLRFHKLSVQSGLANTTVNDIVQDSLGFIWIGTSDGLSRYDGEHFKTFRHQLNEQHTLSDNYIQSLHLDDQNRLWIMTDNGLNRYDIKTDSFKIYRSDSSDPASLSANSVTSLSHSSSGIYYVGTYGGGVNILKDSIFENVAYQPDQENSLSSDLVFTTYLQDDSLLWVGTQDAGVNLYHTQSGEVERFNYGIGGFTRSPRINDIMEDSRGNVWFATEKGISIFRGRDKHMIHLAVTPSQNTGLIDDDILSLREDYQGQVWIGTRQKGLMIAPLHRILEQGRQTRYRYFLPADNGTSVYNRTVQSIFQDRSGNMWLGTYNAGVNFVDPDERSFRHYTSEQGEIQLSHRNVWGLCQDHQGNLWVGTDGGGVDRLNLQRGKVKHFGPQPGTKNSLRGDAILCALEDHRKRLWLGTYEKGLNRYDPRKDRWQNYQVDQDDPHALNANDVRVLFEDQEQTLWVGSNGGGLQWYDPHTDHFHTIAQLANLDVRCINQDTAGHLWIGTFGNGLMRYDPQSNNIAEYTSEEQGIFSNIIFSIEFSSPRDMWIGMRDGGLVHHNLKTGSFTTYSEEDGLANNTVHSIVAENENKIWLSTNRSISLFEVNAQQFTNYDDFDGVQPGRFNDNSGLKTHMGYIAFGGIRGLNLFDPDRVTHHPGFPPVILTDLLIFNEKVDVHDSQVLNKNISMTNEITLDYDQSVFTLNFTALDFPFSASNHYAFKLDRYEDRWNLVSDNPSATYRNLSPGEYEFQVKASSRKGVWGDSYQSLRIKVEPPFWWTWPAILIYILVSTIILLMILRYYTRQIKLRSSLYYEKKLRQQEHQLNEERVQFFTNFSHELRTPLSLIIGPARDLMQSLPEGSEKKKVGIINRNGIMLKELIDKLLEFRKTETGTSKMKVGHYDLAGFIEGYTEDFLEPARKKEIEFGRHLPDEPVRVWFDKAKMQIILNNLLSNAFKYTKPGGQIDVDLWEEEDQILLKIADTGKGIPREKLDAVFQRFYQAEDKPSEGTGIGLALCKTLVEQHKGSISVESEYRKGTTFTLSFLKGYDHFEGQKGYSFKKNYQELHENRETQLPDPSFESSAEPQERVRGDGSYTVLIVDDNPDMLVYLEDTLNGSYQVISARDGEEGIQTAQHQIPDLIISDVMMPRKDGMDFTHTLKNSPQTSHIPIILLTAKTTMDSKIRGFEEGADEYLIKPFEKQLLLTRISNLLQERKRLQEYFSRHPFASPEQAGAKEQEFLKELEEKARAYLEQGDVSVPELARSLGFSRTSLYRKVKAVLGKSINQYLREVKLKKAASLFASGETNVSQAAFHTGFKDLKYFRKCFRELYGKNPSDYMNDLGS